MTPLAELLQRRDSASSGELLLQIKEGLAHHSAGSGAGAATHQLLLDYFKLDARASESSFAAAFKKYPTTAEALRELAQAQGLTQLCALLQSVLERQARPTGAFKAGLQTQANALQGKPDKAGVLAGLKGFASVAFASADSEADMELSLAWGALEEGLLDQLALHADVINFQWGPTELKKREQAQGVRTALAGQSAVQLLQSFFADASPQVLAQPSEWDMEKEGAPTAVVPIPVQHLNLAEPLPAGWAAQLTQAPAAAQLLAVYQQVNGVALFCTDPTDVWSAGFVFLPASMWDEAQAEVLQWLSSVDYQDDPDALPAWVRSAIPFGKIPGDASYWILPVDGPHAGQVLLSNDDVTADTSRYACFDDFVASLRLTPEQVLGSGGYVSYPGPGDTYLLYPVGYRGTFRATEL